MSWGIRTKVAWVCVMSFGSAVCCRAGQSGPTPAAINIHVYNYAKAPASTVAGAKNEAEGVLRKAGMEAVWLDCATTPEEIQVAAACREEYRMNLTLRIIPKATARSSRHALGASLHVAGSGDYITIFYDRIQEMSRSTLTSEQDLMGLAIAHETGHLLLSEPAHSRCGIMRGHWNAADLKRAEENRLGFSPEQASEMRAELMMRMRQGAMAEGAQRPERE